MSRGDRSIFAAAIFGLIVCGWGAGLMTASTWPEHPERYPYYHNESSNTPPSPTPIVGNSLKTPEKQIPCNNPRNREESGLCAEWRAAKAGEEATNAAWWQVIFSFLGVLGLGVTLGFNLLAWKMARANGDETKRSLVLAEQSAEAVTEANKIARQFGHAQTRPYLILDVNTIEVGVFAFPPMSNIFIKATMKNFGSTPAIDPSIAARFRIIPQINGEDGDVIYKSFMFQDELVRNSINIGTTIGTGEEYTGKWAHTIFKNKWDNLSFIFDEGLYPIRFSGDIYFTYADYAGEVLGGEFYRIDCIIESPAETGQCRVLRGYRDPHGADDIYISG